MPAIYEHRLLVVDEDIDELGHANNLVYIRWMIDAALAHSAAQGWPNQRYFDLGMGWVVRAHEITYLRPALLDDAIVVRTWVANWRRATSTRRYQIIRGGDQKTLANAATQWAFVHFESGMPRRIPSEVTESFIVVDEPPN